jgi:hypothetical protein
MAIEYNGSSQYIQCGSGASLDDIANISIAFWANWDAFTQNNAVSKDNASAGQALQGWYCGQNPYYSGNRVVYAHGFTGATGLWTGPTLSTGTRYHIGITYVSPGPPVMYVAGVSQSVTQQLAPSGTPISDASYNLLTAAYLTGDFNSYFDGKLEDVRIANVIWTATQFSQLAAGYMGALGGEVGWWSHLEANGIGGWPDGTGLAGSNTLPDKSGSGNTGTPTNTPTIRNRIAPMSGSRVMIIAARRWQEFMRDLKRGLVPPSELRRRYREAMQI